MRYRDDRDALRHRANNLETDLEAAERRLREAEDELRQHEEKDAREQQELEALRKEVERLKPTKPEVSKPATAPQNAALSVGLAVAFGALLFGFFLMTGGPEEGSDPVPQPAAPLPAEAQLPAVGPPVVSAVEQKRGTGLFGARVLASDDPKIPAGTPCVVEASLASAGSEVGVKNVVVQCEGERIYDAATPIGGGMQNRSGGALELSTDGRHHYLAEFSLTGQWDGERPQMKLSTKAQQARVWSEGLEPRSIALRVDDFGFPRRGEALSKGEDGFRDGRWIHRPLTLTAKKGAVPDVLATPQDCELRVRPTPTKNATGEATCRVVVACRGGIVYGATTTGWTTCRGDGEAILASDQGTTDVDGDPAMELEAETVKVHDERDGGAWDASFRIEAPACLANGPWRVHLLGEAPRQGVLEVTGEQAQLTWGDGAPEPLAVTACDDAGVTLRAADGEPFTLALGPGFVTAGGNFADGAPIALLKTTPR